jgi:hypothetical protein
LHDFVDVAENLADAPLCGAFDRFGRHVGFLPRQLKILIPDPRGRARIATQKSRSSNLRFRPWTCSF